MTTSSATRVVDAAWTRENLARVMRVVASGRGMTRADDARCRERALEGARAMATSDDDDDDDDDDAYGIVARACCEAMMRTCDDGDDDADEDEGEGEEARETETWFGTLCATASTSARALERALEATRRAAAMDERFTERACEEYDASVRRLGDAKDATLAVLIEARAWGRAREASASASDVERALRACDARSLDSMAKYVLEEVKESDAHLLRAIARRDSKICVDILGALLSRLSTSVQTRAALRALEEIVQMDMSPHVEGMSSEIQRAIEYLPQLSVKEGESIARRAAAALSKISGVAPAMALFESVEDDCSKTVLGLQMLGDMMQAGNHLDAGVAALERAMVDDRSSVRQHAFVVATTLITSESIDEAMLQKAEAEAKVDAILSINEILRALSQRRETPTLSFATIQSLTSSLGLILALDVSGKSVKNREILRNSLRLLSALSECLILQAESARDTDGEQINFIDADAFDDANDKVESNVLAKLVPVVEVVLDSMLSYSTWFKEMLEQLEHPKIDEGTSETLESWITRLLFMHLQLSCGSENTRAGNVSSALCVDSCVRLSSDDAEWSPELQRHITQICANTLRVARVSSGDMRASNQYATLMNTCARQCVETLRDNWFAFDKKELALNSDLWSTKTTLDALQTLRALCELAVSRNASFGPDLGVLQDLMRASFTDDELENAAKEVASYGKPHLARNDYEAAGRAGVEAPVSGVVAALVTSLHHQLQETYNSRTVIDTWDRIITEVLNLLDTMIPLLENADLASASVVMLEDDIIQLRELPIEPTCHIACTILQYHRRRFPLPDCVKTASEMLKMALSYSLTSIPDELNDLLGVLNEIVTDLSSDNDQHGKIEKQDAFIALTTILVKSGDVLWRHVHSKQKSLDDVEANFVSLATHSFERCISAASKLSRTDGNQKHLESQRRNASLVLAGIRLHHNTDKMSHLYDVKVLRSFELKRRQFMVVCAGVFTNLRALQLVKNSGTPLDRGLVAIGNALAMDDIELYSENLSRLGESVQNVDGETLKCCPSNVSSRENSASKPRKRIRNPYLDAVVAQEGGAQDEYDDMADFIVCKPGRDYRTVLGLT